MTFAKWAACIALAALMIVRSVSADTQSPTTALASDADIFATAQSERSAGLYTQAIAKFRDLLRRNPGDATVREELGYALLLDKQYAAAQFQFQILAESSTDPQRRALYRAVLQRILAERPAGVSLVFEWVPSSNINNGSDGDRLETAFGVFRITDASQAQSGWRRKLGLEGFLRAPIGPQDQVIFDWRAVNTRYSDDVLPAVDDVSASLTWRHIGPVGHYQLSFGKAAIRTDFETIDETRVTVAAGRRLTANTRFDVALRHARLSYQIQPDKSGPANTATLRHTWSLAKTQTFWVGVAFEDARPDRAHQRFEGRILQFGGRKVLGAGTEIDAQVSFGVRDFKGVFPGQSFARLDRFQELLIGVQDARIRFQGFTPRATCRVRLNESNVALFDATTRECGIALTRRF